MFQISVEKCFHARILERRDLESKLNDTTKSFSEKSPTKCIVFLPKGPQFGNYALIYVCNMILLLLLMESTRTGLLQILTVTNSVFLFDETVF